MEELLALLGPEKANKILSLAATDPDTVGEVLSALAADPVTMRCVAGDIPPAFEPFADYITDIDERCHLFNEFRRIIPAYTSINVTTFACFMVAPIPEIRDFLSSDSTVPGLVTYAGNRLAPFAIRACTFPLLFVSTWTYIFL